MNETSSEPVLFDGVTGLIFFISSMFAVAGAWWYSLRRVRAYSRHYAGHRAVRFPKSPQLTLGTFNGEPAWQYSYSW